MSKNSLPPDSFTHLNIGGRIPPQNIDAEEAVLGGIMIEPRSIYRVLTVFKGDNSSRVLYKDANRLIFEAILDLHRENIEPNMLNVNIRLRNKGHLEAAGGTYYLTQLTDKVGHANNIEHHCRLIWSEYAKREIIKTNEQTTRDAYELGTDPLEISDNARKQLGEITDPLVRLTAKVVGELILPTIQKLEEDVARVKDRNGEMLGVPTGIRPLDHITGGDEDDELTCVGGVPGSGKSTFAMTAMYNAAKMGRPQAFFSLEMTRESLMRRLISMVSGVPHHKIKRKMLEADDFARINEAASVIEKLPLYIDYCPGMKLDEFQSKCRRYKSDYGIERFTLDYAHLMVDRSSKVDTRHQLNDITRTSKEICGTLEVPTWLLGQFNQTKIDSRAEKRPFSSDFKETSTFSEDADKTYLLYRPAIYEFKNPGYKDRYYKAMSDQDFDSMCILIIDKQRNGPVADIPIVMNMNNVIMKEQLEPMVWEQINALNADMRDYLQAINPHYAESQYSLEGSAAGILLDQDDPF